MSDDKATTRTIKVRVPDWEDEAYRRGFENQLRLEGYRVKSAELSIDPEHYEITAEREDD
jgi:hypothetical protein